jgi:hypothetical protein
LLSIHCLVGADVEVVFCLSGQACDGLGGFLCAFHKNGRFILCEFAVGRVLDLVAGDLLGLFLPGQGDAVGLCRCAGQCRRLGPYRVGRFDGSGLLSLEFDGERCLSDLGVVLVGHGVVF